MPLGSIDQADLVIQCPEIIDITQAEDPDCTEINQARNPFPHIHPVDTKQAEKRQQQPGEIEINLSFAVADICIPVHAWYKEQIDYPTYKE